MPSQIISDSPAHSTGSNSLWEKPTFELNFTSTQQITLEWIQALPSELKDIALYRLCKVVESKPTMVESFTLSQVLYRTLSGNTFTESAESVAERTGCDRKTILKGLNQAVFQNILEENKRPGTSNEYSFKPVEEWLSEPVIRNKDNRTKKVIEFPKIQNTGEAKIELQLPSNNQVVRETDDHETDVNTVVVFNNLKEQQQEVSVHDEDSATIWRRNPDDTRYCQIPPIYDQDTGVEIQRQMDFERLTAQSVVKRAIALSKAPLMLLELFINLRSAFANSSLNLQPEPTVAQNRSAEVLVSLQLSKTLETINVNLSPRQLQKCVKEYGEDVMLNAANELKRTGVLANKENPTGYFLGCLKNGMGQKSATVQTAEPEFEEEQVKPVCSTTEMGQALKKPVASFSHVEINPRVTVARLIIDGQYQRAAILAGLYGVDYEELVTECGVLDDPEAIILLRKVTK